jgi:serum/glucocorticoid-regulated kinase 2
MMPAGWSLDAADFVNRMLQKQPKNRIGSMHGSLELKEHPWLADFPWQALDSKSLRSSYVPAAECNYDHKNIQEAWTDLNDPEFVECQKSLSNIEV